jgi:hypothetical protein
MRTVEEVVRELNGMSYEEIVGMLVEKGVRGLPRCSRECIFANYIKAETGIDPSGVPMWNKTQIYVYYSVGHGAKVGVSIIDDGLRAVDELFRLSEAAEQVMRAFDEDKLPQLFTDELKQHRRVRAMAIRRVLDAGRVL